MRVLKKLKISRVFKILILLLVLCSSLLLRFLIFDERGGDYAVYKKAVVDFTTSVNPYIYTVASFTDPILDHGYAYPPTLLYMLSFVWKLNILLNTNIPSVILWKIPVLLADLGVFFLIIKYFYKTNFYLGVLAGGAWLLNPHFVARYEYTLFDPIQIFFLLLAVSQCGKRDRVAGLFLGLAISIKLIPLIVFPILFYFAKQKFYLVFYMFVTLFAISMPFMIDKTDFEYYIRGAFLVHEGREIQGRPILSFATYNLNRYGVNFFQNKYYSTYTILALISGPLLSLYLIFRRKYKNPGDAYSLCFLTFCCYYLFTPILNRTHVLWFFPFMLIGLYELVKKSLWLYLVLTIIVYMAIYKYLLPWNGGLTPSLTEPGGLHMSNNKSTAGKPGIGMTLLLTYYDYRHKWFEN